MPILVLGAAPVAVNVLYLLMSTKWVVSLVETIVNVGVLLMFYTMIMAFPFSPELTPSMKTGIYLLLCLVFLGMAIGIARNFLQTIHFINYSNEGITG
jgi:hypothetical protein